MKPSSTSGAQFFSWLKGGIILTVLTLGLISFSGTLLAATAAGQVIQNQASADYTDANNNTYTAQSNVASIEVKQVFSAELTTGQTKSAAAGQIVYFQHTLSNTGNGSDTYTIATADITAVAGTVGVDDFKTGAVNIDDANFTTLKVFHDLNANGQVDAGEPELTGATNTITIAASGAASIVIEATAPIASNTSEVAASLSATATAGLVTDTGRNFDAEVASITATNHDEVNITTDAVLNVTKSFVFVPPATAGAAGTIEFTIQVQNTGTTSAFNVVLWDGIPFNTTNPVSLVSTGFGANAGDVSLAIAANAEEATLNGVARDLDGDGNTTDTTEALLGIDVNGDGDTLDNLNGLSLVFGFDAELPANTTVSFTYTVTVSGLAAGDLVKNIGFGCADVDNNVATADGCVPSNEVIVTFPQYAALEISDTGLNDAVDTNNGGDDLLLGTTSETTGNNDGTEAAGADIQFVERANDGETVLFLSNVTNNGNGADTFQLTVPSSAAGGDNGAAFDAHADSTANLATYIGTTVAVTTDATANNQVPDSATTVAFPVGTTFTFWDATGNNQLLDTDADGTVDTGPINSAATLVIMVKAILPAGTDDQKLHAASVVATSAYDSAQDDTKVLLLGPIIAASVDLTNAGVDHTEAGANAVNTYQAGNTPVTTLDSTGASWTTAILPGTTVAFPIRINNAGGTPDAYQLSAGASWAGAGNALGAMNPGWSVVFQDAACAAAPALTGGGAVITTTAAIAGGATTNICAYVTVSSTVTEALGDYTAGLLNLDNNPAGADGDEDYPVFFRVVSLNTGAEDVKLDAVDVDVLEQITLLPDNSGQVQPGGSIDYAHTLKNEGNTVEAFVFTAASSAAGFTNTVQVYVDSNADADNDPLTNPGNVTLKSWSLVVAGELVVITNAAGTDVNYTVPATPSVTLNAAEQMALQVRVFAPASAPNGTIDTTVVTATYNGGGATATASDQTTVILGQLRLYKKVALDVGCDNTADVAFAAALGAVVEPTQCAIWQIVAVNEGAATSSKVVIHDAAPAFTTYLAGSMRSCAGDATTDAAGSGCTNDAVINDADSVNTDAADDESAAHADNYFAEVDGAGNITVFIGTGATQTTGGSIAAGASVTVRFTTTVD